MLSYYSFSKLRYGSLTLNIKVIKSLKHDNINNASNRNNHAKLYLPSTFQTSDIELLSPPKIKLDIYLTKSPKHDHKLCLYT